MPETGSFSIKQFKPASQDYKIAKILLDGKTREEVIKELFPLVGKREPFIYRENIGGGRRRKPMEDQYRLFLYNVNRTIGKMKDQGFVLEESYSDRTKWSSKERHWVNWRRKYIQDLIDQGIGGDPPVNLDIPKPGSVTPVDPQGNPITKTEQIYYSQDDLANMATMLEQDGLLTWIGDKAVEAEQDSNSFDPPVAEWERNDDGELKRKKVSNKPGKYETAYKGLTAEQVKEAKKPEPVVVKPPTRVELIDDFYKRMMLARDFVISRELGGEYLDFISTRALKDGAKAIAFGLHSDEVMAAITKTWSEDSRREFERHERSWKPSEPKINVKNYPVPIEGGHMYLGYVYILAQARIPVFLVGPSGSGKSFMARDLADVFECEYGELPLTAGATPSWLVGAETISGYKSRPFVDIYENGGVFCFEEMDAADPNMLLIVNNAIANNFFTNPVTGREIEKSRDFIPIATANTWGLGANRQYTGRERLDAATLDRWRVGRVEVDYDDKVEKAIISDMKELAEKKEKKSKPKKAATGFK